MRILPSTNIDPYGLLPIWVKTYHMGEPRQDENQALDQCPDSSCACSTRRALETAGVEFIDENGGGPGVRLRKRHRPKAPKILNFAQARKSERKRYQGKFHALFSIVEE